jgi:acyl-CoA reductase-like NAD-dependent aldehyde dehydrogenase
MQTYGMLIDGSWVSSAETFDVKNPATDAVIARVPKASAADVDRAVQAARRAFEGGWRDVTAQERGRILLRLAEKMRVELPRLAQIETENSGKPIVESEYDLTDVATCFEYICSSQCSRRCAP